MVGLTSFKRRARRVRSRSPQRPRRVTDRSLPEPIVALADVVGHAVVLDEDTSTRRASRFAQPSYPPQSPGTHCYWNAHNLLDIAVRYNLAEDLGSRSTPK